MRTDTLDDEFHLAVFTEEFYPNTSGGAHTRWLFSQNVVERGGKVTVFTMREPGTERSESVNGVRILRPVPGSPSFIPVYSNLSLPFRILSSFLIFLYAVFWFAQRDVDAIHTASHSFHWVGKTLSVIYSLPLTNFMGYTPSVRGDDSWSLRRVLERANFKLFMGQTVYCRTESVKKVVETSGPTDVRVLHGILNTENITDGADTDTAVTRAEYGVSEDEILVVFVGRFVPIKRPNTAVDVLQSLPEEYRLVMIGDGPEQKRVREYVQSNGLSSRVTLTGRLSHKETLKVVKASDVLLLTSTAEAYPTVVFEALALGSHVVAPPVGVLPSITHPELYLSPINQHADKIRQLEHGSYAIQTETMENYSIDRYTSEILSRSLELRS